MLYVWLFMKAARWRASDADARNTFKLLTLLLSGIDSRAAHSSPGEQQHEREPRTIYAKFAAIINVRSLLSFPALLTSPSNYLTRRIVCALR